MFVFPVSFLRSQILCCDLCLVRAFSCFEVQLSSTDFSSTDDSTLDLLILSNSPLPRNNEFEPLDLVNSIRGRITRCFGYPRRSRMNTQDPIRRSDSVSSLILDAERLVKLHMDKYDPSHDWFHGEPLTV
jgi:hypothetical protein